MAKTRFMVVKEGYGKTGVKLDLNLAQCEELGLLAKRNKETLESIIRCDGDYNVHSDALALDVLNRTVVFLSLFNEFARPDMLDLWELGEKQQAE